MVLLLREVKEGIEWRKGMEGDGDVLSSYTSFFIN